MRNSTDTENKIFITLVVLIVLLFIGLFIGRNYVFNYIDSHVSLGGTTSELVSSATSQEFNFDKREVMDLKIFNKKKFNELEKNSFRVPPFKVGEKDIFQK